MSTGNSRRPRGARSESHLLSSSPIPSRGSNPGHWFIGNKGSTVRRANRGGGQMGDEERESLRSRCISSASVAGGLDDQYPYWGVSTPIPGRSNSRSSSRHRSRDSCVVCKQPTSETVDEDTTRSGDSWSQLSRQCLDQRRERERKWVHADCMDSVCPVCHQVNTIRYLKKTEKRSCVL